MVLKRRVGMDNGLMQESPVKEIDLNQKPPKIFYNGKEVIFVSKLPTKKKNKGKVKPYLLVELDLRTGKTKKTFKDKLDG